MSMMGFIIDIYPLWFQDLKWTVRNTTYCDFVGLKVICCLVNWILNKENMDQFSKLYGL